MKGFLRRLRGIIGTGITWAFGWAASFALIYLGLSLSGGFQISQLGVASLVGSIYGFVAGGSFAVILSIAERRRTLDQLSLKRVALWGGIGGAVLVFWAVPTIMGAGIPLGEIFSPGFLLRGSIVTLLGAGFSSGSVAIARRKDTKLLEGDGDSVESLEGDEEPLPALEGK